ncbi:MAG: hypothetical protein HYZ50_21620 [Deltaproteobacteria bacterium]|nr:hypothetical protein [Deltaproteobacteria bacterium]
MAFDFSPSSFFSAPPPAVADRIRRQPECRLLWAVLENAVGTYMKYTLATRRRPRRLFREAQDWIWRDDPTWLCSFVSICYVVGVDPDYLRRGLRKWHETQSLPHFKQAA